jgi:hypothetical protein
MASTKITLPSGAEVTLRDPKTLRVKDRRQVFRAASKEEGVLQAMSLVDGLIAVLIEDWTLDLLIPSIKIESIDELEMADYDFLAKEANKAQKVLFPTLEETEESKADPESPFDNSNA